MAGERFKPEKAAKLISADRRKVLPPDLVIEKMGLNPDDVVADLGAGIGYFSIPIAKTIHHKVYAVDIEPKMLDMLKDRASEEQVTNIECVASDLENIEIGDAAVDKLLVAFVLHEVPNLAKALNEMRRILKSDGKVMILEWEAVESESGPPLHERIPSGKLAKIIQENGFDTSVFHVNDAIYGVTASRIEIYSSKE